MKKVLSIAVLCAGFLSAYAIDSFRVDLRGVKDVTLANITLSEGMAIALQTPKKVTEGITKAYIYSDSKKLTDKYQKFTISFVPEEDGRVGLHFHTPGSKDRSSIIPVIIDDVQITGAKFKNGGFETVNGDRPAGWSIGKGAKFITDKTQAAEGNNCMQIFYGNGIAGQNLHVTADDKVTITFQARLAK